MFHVLANQSFVSTNARYSEFFASFLCFPLQRSERNFNQTVLVWSLGIVHGTACGLTTQGLRVRIPYVSQYEYLGEERNGKLSNKAFLPRKKQSSVPNFYCARYDVQFKDPRNASTPCNSELSSS